MTESASLTGPANKAANQLLTILRLFTQRMILGRTMAKIAGAFKKTYLKTGKMGFSLLEGMDFQEDYPFNELCKGMVMKKIEEDTLHLLIPVGNRNVTKLSNLADGYQLQAILLFGDPSKENGLRIDVEPSRWYSFKEEEGNIDCSFSLVLPPKNRPWMVLLYVVCSFNVKAQPGPQYRRMKVVKVGSF